VKPGLGRESAGRRAKPTGHEQHAKDPEADHGVGCQVEKNPETPFVSAGSTASFMNVAVRPEVFPSPRRGRGLTTRRSARLRE